MLVQAGESFQAHFTADLEKKRGGCHITNIMNVVQLHHKPTSQITSYARTTETLCQHNVNTVSFKKYTVNVTNHFICLLVFLQIFGFLNLILWSGNCWFIYKETPFHKDPKQPTTVEEGGTPGP